MLHSVVYSSVGSSSLSYLSQGSRDASPERSSEAVSTDLTRSHVSSTRVELSGLSHSVQRGHPEGVDAYKAVDQASDANNPYARTILKFVELQLQRDVASGASPEELQSRIEAGLAGFEAGYNEAFAQLKDSGLLSESVRDSIQGTFDEVREGISQMAEQFGLESPVVADPRAPIAAAGQAPTEKAEMTSSAPPAANPKDLLHLESIKQLKHWQSSSNTYEHLSKPKMPNSSQSMDYGVGQSRSFHFQLKTQEGDEVTIQFHAERMGAAAYTADKNAFSVALAESNSTRFSFSVAGDLNADEVKSISDLLSQVNAISQDFFSGDFDKAFEMALRLDHDDKEIAEFAVNLRAVGVERGAVAGMLEGEHSTSRVGDGENDQGASALHGFLEQLRELAGETELMGYQRDWIAELTDLLADTVYADNARAALLSPFVRAAL